MRGRSLRGRRRRILRLGQRERGVCVEARQAEREDGSRHF
jgi:hypothetical protein